MSKKKIPPPLKHSGKMTKTPVKLQGTYNNSIHSLMIANCIAGIVLLTLLSMVKKNNVGYSWMWEGLLKKNVEIMREGSGLTDYDKNKYRHGNLFLYLDEINKATPKEALILMPPDSIVDQLNPKLKLEGLKDRRKVTFFIYPRRALYPGNKWDQELIPKATHIAIVNYKGYEQLRVAPKTKKPFTVIPLQ